MVWLDGRRRSSYKTALPGRNEWRLANYFET